MLKLYRKTESGIFYWETWENGKVHTIHWGKLGERGQSKEITDSLFRAAKKIIQAEIDEKIADGYQQIPDAEHHVLLIEYAVQGMGTAADLEKRHRLQSRMDETLGWTGLGNCDGGSIGSGTMEVCCYVVDFATAEIVIAADLRDSEFSNFSRIYREDA